ncbi:cytochrome P450 [Artemisia annua]|uniref:Cytochrome P450 n=1 Tax=Artemisia annua TaxID=35608 RepID=A0A2U1KRV2_ARTAN|nr:cytochrome P450 [Artemisia annua]
MLTNSVFDLEPILVRLKAKYGPFITLPIVFNPSFFVGCHSLAHEILIQNGALCSDRPKTLPVLHISTSPYGPTWRILRRNLASEIMNPYRIKSYSWARKWVLCNLTDKLQEHVASEDGIKVIDYFHHAMFSLLVSMCFGNKLDEGCIKEIAKVQADMQNVIGRFRMLAMFPRLGKILLRKSWKEFERVSKNKEQVFIPIIKSRIESAKQNVAYVDTLVNIQLPQEEARNGDSRKLTYKEMADMCSEFFNAGTETATIALHWIMANLVKYPHIQSKLYDEIITVVGSPPSLPRKGVELESVINEDNIQKMSYLKAVVLEGLRRHSPSHFLLPHSVTKEAEVQGYTIPQGATINFLVAEMGLDPKVWDDPMEFKPERFLSTYGSKVVFDIKGNKEIKMIPFGAGRRICPGYELALLHLEYLVANLIWYFHWTTPHGRHVDLSEKTEFFATMKNPLITCISLRNQRKTT